MYRASLAEGRAVTAKLTPALQRPQAPDYKGGSLGQIELSYTDAAPEPRAQYVRDGGTTRCAHPHRARSAGRSRRGPAGTRDTARGHRPGRGTPLSEARINVAM